MLEPSQKNDLKKYKNNGRNNIYIFYDASDTLFTRSRRRIYHLPKKINTITYYQWRQYRQLFTTLYNMYNRYNR